MSEQQATEPVLSLSPSEDEFELVESPTPTTATPAAMDTSTIEGMTSITTPASNEGPTDIKSSNSASTTATITDKMAAAAPEEPVVAAADNLNLSQTEIDPTTTPTETAAAPFDIDAMIQGALPARVASVVYYEQPNKSAIAITMWTAPLCLFSLNLGPTLMWLSVCTHSVSVMTG